MGGQDGGGPPLPLDTDHPPTPTLLGVSFCFSFSVPLCLNLLSALKVLTALPCLRAFAQSVYLCLDGPLSLHTPCPG